MKPESRSRRRVPAFTPVPLRHRKDGWTPLRQADFLGRLTETASVSAAARGVGMTRESAYRLRGKPGGESFAAAWDAVLAQSAPPPKCTFDRLWHRAIHGTLKPVMHRGKHVATVASPDDDAFLRLCRRTLQGRGSGSRQAGKSQS